MVEQINRSVRFVIAKERLRALKFGAVYRINPLQTIELQSLRLSWRDWSIKGSSGKAKHEFVIRDLQLGSEFNERKATLREIRAFLFADLDGQK